jgi:flagellar hook-associated protein 1
MAVGINSLLNIGNQALFANQTALNVTANNIANVNTIGYSRQRVNFEDGLYLDSNPGQIGTGVAGGSIQRIFSDFIESQYNDKESLATCYDVLYQNLQYVESIFGTTDSGDMGTQLSTFFADWQSLTTSPENFANRQTLLNDTQSLISIFQEGYNNLSEAQAMINQQVSKDVDQANQLIKDIAGLNGQIAADTSDTNTPNGLLDTRATKIRQLSALLNVTTIDRGNGDMMVMSSNGSTLVHGTTTYELKFLNNQTINFPTANSPFNGKVYFEGNDDFEYTLKVVQGGNYSGDPVSGAKFMISLDGGNTWVTSGSGQVATYTARDFNSKVSVGNLKIFFGQASNSGLSPTGNLGLGDQFTLVPKSGVYWFQSASTPINLTPQKLLNGQDNDKRLTGGEIAGMLSFRDSYAGRYKQKLDTLANALIWEVNSLHSQGSGLDFFGDTTGTYSVNSTSMALGSNSTGLVYGNRLASGASMMYFYSADTGALASASSFGMLNFGAPGSALTGFDPNKNSLSDVASAINNTYGTFCTASIVNNRLRITAKEGYKFAFGADATGLYAALGLNTFFDGSSASSITLTSTVNSNNNFINAGHVDVAGQSNQGDNTTALAMAALQRKGVSLSNPIDGTSTQTLGSYYNSLVASIGSDTATAKFNYQFNSTIAKDLDSQQSSISGVNLDEEMSNLIKYQHSYQAAAKLITTADQMLQTVLGLKS